MLSSIMIPYTVVSFENHSKIKDTLLEDIEKPYPKIISYDHHISKSDYYDNNQNSTYKKIFLDHLLDEMKDISKFFNFEKFVIHNIWFQQYTSQDSHPWHNHAGCQYTCIYYLELSKDSPVTQFINPINENNVFQIEVKEGDILIIPSVIKHQSPPSKSTNRKTIISFNLSFCLDNNATDTINE